VVKPVHKSACSMRSALYFLTRSWEKDFYSVGLGSSNNWMFNQSLHTLISTSISELLSLWIGY